MVVAFKATKGIFVCETGILIIKTSQNVTPAGINMPLTLQLLIAFGIGKHQETDK
jgi:hypothetical protein